MIRYKCSLCALYAVHENIVIAIGEADRFQQEKPKTLNLCELDYRRLVKPLIDAVDDYGLDYKVPKPGKKKAATVQRGTKRNMGPFKCQVEGCVSTLMKNAATLQVHLGRVHEMTLEAYQATYGLKVATPEERRVEIRIACEMCDTVYSTAFGNRNPAAAMRSHMRGRHGLQWHQSKGVVGKVGE